jgi:hypothetical protein
MRRLASKSQAGLPWNLAAEFEQKVTKVTKIKAEKGADGPRIARIELMSQIYEGRQFMTPWPWWPSVQNFKFLQGVSRVPGRPV